MTNEKIETITGLINTYINSATIEFKAYGSSTYYNLLYSRICGMIEVLATITGKDYYFDANGLHEREHK